jgi:hypothetical protein
MRPIRSALSESIRSGSRTAKRRAAIASPAAGYCFPRRSRLAAGGPLKETAMTDQKISPRFVFLSEALETTQVGPQSFIDAYPTATNPQFEAAKAGDTVRIHLATRIRAFLDQTKH